ncbi:MAG: DUF1826 domain-containing protein [Gammaproteobacteria bacterium]|nr:DUF1826 domain-containing protein [Gammaproteobacteria bacterium]
MSNGYQNQAAAVQPFVADETKLRFAARGGEPKVLSDIYAEDINIAIWERSLSLSLSESVDMFVTNQKVLEASFTTSAANAGHKLQEMLGFDTQSELTEDIANLVEMFCDLFGLKRIGLRLAILDRAMCPRFHVDRVPCRLVTTYYGLATEWLPHAAVDRNHLGAVNAGNDDAETGLFGHQSEIQQLASGNVAVLKGELWEGNENAGLVHRSPVVGSAANRLLLSIDFCD